MAAPTVYAGRKVFIWIDLNGGEGARNYVKIGQQRGGSISRSTETADATHKDDDGAPSAVPTRMPWSFGCDGALKVSDSALGYIKASWKAGTPVMVKWDESTISGEVVEGYAIITKYGKEAPEGDLVSYSLEFQGNGQLADV